MSTPSFAVGDRVVCDPAQTPARYHGTVWIVDGFGPKNAILKPADGVGKGLRIPPALLLPAPDDDAPATTSVAQLLPPLMLGAVVTVTSPVWKGTPGLHVVLADHGDTVKLVVLGGDNHRYWPKVPRVWLREVDRTALLAAVGALATSGDGPR